MPAGYPCRPAGGRTGLYLKTSSSRPLPPGFFHKTSFSRLLPGSQAPIQLKPDFSLKTSRGQTLPLAGSSLLLLANMSSVTCNAAITTLDDLDDGEGGDIEEIARESDPPLLNFILPTTPWGGQGQVLLRAKPRESGSDSQRLVSQLDEWLANRDPGPADVVLLRCRRGIECNTCSVQASERCDPQGGQFCRACLDHEPIYCAFGSPCSKWNDYKTQEFVRRQRSVSYTHLPLPPKA